jgi:hypothetical protein
VASQEGLSSMESVTYGLYDNCKRKIKLTKLTDSDVTADGRRRNQIIRKWKQAYEDQMNCPL